MKISMHIDDVTPAVLAAISSITGVKTTLYKTASASTKPAPVRKHKWSRKAKQNLKVRTPDAPYGLKKDGTPRAKPGAPKKAGA